uniref:C3H1-type domain-containing protein n=1 Tax=Alexandrium monilatum TaxID=311494 RepID=A0A7S4PTD7_9DINO
MLCRFWQQGSCRHGDQCRYQHGGGAGPVGGGPPPAPPGKGQVCRDFLRGSCRYGGACRYVHAEDGQKGGQGGRGKGGHWNRPAGQGCGKGGFEGKGPGPFKGPGGGDLRSLTGPYLGKGSELLKIWYMPETQGHDDGIYAACVMGDRVCTGGGDRRLLVWTGHCSPQGTLSFVEDNAVEFPAAVSSLLFHGESKWLFCGLFDGQIKAYRQEPFTEATLIGHGEAVTSMLIHESVLLSGSHDGTIRAWQHDPGSGGFRCAATVQSPLGQVFKIHVQPPSSLWVGAQRGISCVNLQTMQPVGNIEAPARVVGLLPYENSIIAGFANGVVKAYDPAGNEQFSQGPLGEHTTNTTISMMRIPRINKDVLLCGQEFGYVTVYDMPDFKPRGSFTTGWDGEVMAIVDMMADGVFVTCGLSGDVVIWRWREDGGAAMLTEMVSSSPF